MTHPLSRPVLGFAMLMFLLTAGACGPSLKNITVMEDGRYEHVYLQWLQDGNQIIPQGYDHPTKLTAEQLLQILEAIRFEENSFFKWRDQGVLFIEAEREKLASRLAEALQRATADQWAHFSVTGMKTHLLFKTKHMTDGLCFVKDNQFHLVIGNFNVEVIEPDRELYRLDPRDRLIVNSLRLSVDPERGIDRPPIVEGDERLSKERRNWLVVDLDTFFATAEPPAVETPAPVPAPQPPTVEEDEDKEPELIIEERLAKLKELYEKGLITEEEYNRKRQEILEDL